MKKFSLFFAILLVPFLALANPASKRTYRKLVLKNGLKVVLVSDASLNVSSASMDVGVGSLADPDKRLGLAHFLEHMLFLATKKYPKLNEYGEYLKAHGGYSNAFTAADHTNYHFQVNHDGFPEALDRFGHFFIDPLLDYKYAQREVMAVDAEHRKNIPQDTWRIMQLRRSLFKKSHPASKFHTGCLETLKGTTEQELREFFETYYGPTNMALSILSPLSLDEQERLVRKIFSQIPSRKIKIFECSWKVLDPKNALRLVRVVPLKDMRQLKLYFPLPPQYKKVGEKTINLIGMTMGDEGKGSLLSYLKKLGYATSLSAGVGNETRFFSSCGVTVGLTPKGLQNWRQVLTLCMAYFELLRSSPYPKHIWKEMKTLAKLKELYSPKGEGTDRAIAIASNANLYGLKIAEKVESYFTHPDEKDYYQLLSYMKPSNMLVFLVAKGLKTDKKEKWYGTQYSYVEEKGKFFESLQKPSVPNSIHLPLPNPFLPKRLGIYRERPVLIAKNRYYTLWYGQDLEFRRPKVSIMLHILTPNAYNTLRNAVLMNLYVSIIREKLNEFSYPAMMAGLVYNLNNTKKGVLLGVQGYSDSAMKLLSMVSKELVSLEIDDKLFKRVKERMSQSLENFAFSQAYMISREATRKMMLRKYYSPSEMLGQLKKLDLEDLKFFISGLYREAYIEGLGYGNLLAEDLKKTVRHLVKNLHYRPLPRNKVFRDETLWLEKGKTYFYYQDLITGNSCLRIDYQMGMADLKTAAATWILDRALRNAFYTEMRTRQMLGYIVFSGSYERQNIMNLVFIIQSGTHPAYDLYVRADKFIAQIPKLLEKLPDRYFEAVRRSLIQDRQKKAKTIFEKASLFYYLAFNRKGDFDRIDKEIEALKKVTKEDVIQLARRGLSESGRRRIVVLLNGKGHKKPEKLNAVKDIEKFHKGKTFVK